MRRELLVLCLLATALALAGCPSQRPSTAQGVGAPGGATAAQGKAATTASDTDTVMLYVPCGMIIPVRAVMDAFEKQTPGVKVRGVFDNSDVIVNRLVERHEKADLVMTPGNTEMSRLKAAGMLTAEPRHVASFELVVMVPKASALSISGPADLRQCKTIVSADPEINSIGASGKEALSRLGLWDALQPKLVLTKHAIDSHTIVAAGKADAGIAYRNCPLDTAPEKLSKSKVRIAFSFPPSSYTRQPCLVAKLKTSTSPSADKFLEFISSPEGMRLLAASGLTDTPAAGGKKAPGGQSRASAKGEPGA